MKFLTIIGPIFVPSVENACTPYRARLLSSGDILVVSNSHIFLPFPGVKEADFASFTTVADGRVGGAGVTGFAEVDDDAAPPEELGFGVGVVLRADI